MLRTSLSNVGLSFADKYHTIPIYFFHEPVPFGPFLCWQNLRKFDPLFSGEKVCTIKCYIVKCVQFSSSLSYRLTVVIACVNVNIYIFPGCFSFTKWISLNNNKNNDNHNLLKFYQTVISPAHFSPHSCTHIEACWSLRSLCLLALCHG